MQQVRSSRQSGFSLLELMVALTILALAMSVVSISASRRSPSFEIQRLSGETASLLREARLAAQTTGRPARVAFDAEAREIRHGDSAVTVPEGIVADMASAASAGPSAILFFPDGSSSGGALTFSSTDRSETVRVDWLTSRIEREEGE